MVRKKARSNYMIHDASQKCSKEGNRYDWHHTCLIYAHAHSHMLLIAECLPRNCETRQHLDKVTKMGFGAGGINHWERTFSRDSLTEA